MTDCVFCKPDFSKFQNIDRKFYEDDHTIAVLAPGQDVPGYSLVILKKHHRDITDDFNPLELMHLMKTVNLISQALKKVCDAKRIYLASLCDGVEHLHFHLVPRREWTKRDYYNYYQYFWDSRGEDTFRYIRENRIGGFWWLAEFERAPDRPEWEEFDLIKEYKAKLEAELGARTVTQ